MYHARITRKNPTAFLIFIDQSGSMEEATLFNNRQMSKAEAVALTVNMTISELINRCRREDFYADYFEIAVFGYSGNEVRSLLPSGKTFMTPGKLAGSELEKIKLNRERVLPDGRSAISVVEQKIWIKPSCSGKTPMYEALLKCYDIVGGWCADKKHRHCYPPTVFNITDGEASDGDNARLLEIASRIRHTGTIDGNTLLVNIHITSNTNEKPVLFAASEGELPDEGYAKMLFGMSSVMPPAYNENIADMRGGHTAADYRGISYNAGMTDLIGMMNIGSVSVSLMD